MKNSKHDDTRQPTRPGPKRRLKFLTVAILTVAVLVAGIGLGFLTASMNTKPGLTNDIRPPASSQIYDADGRLITTIHAVENRVPVTLNKAPKNLQNAFIAVEDARFYEHGGIDPRGILRAVWSNITNRGVTEGGSTITQQLAKNAFLSQERTLKRKIQEAFLALQIERRYTKNEILEMYLNQIYFGQGAYGVQAAAQTYFGKNVEDLNLAECAMLAGIPKSPNYFSPFNNLKAATERQAVVLDQMVKYHYISRRAADEAKHAKLALASQGKGAGDTGATASYFIDYVTQIMIDKYGADAVYKDGLKIYTTLDLDMQKDAENAMKSLPTYRTDSNGLKQPQGALVAIEPRTGYIRAMVGGRGNDKFNRATMAERQPGSSFKPFVFLAALESGFGPSSIIDDSPVKYGDWEPQNYERTFSGKVTLRTVAEHSMNVPTVKIAHQIGVDKVLYYARQLGINTLVLNGARNDRNLSTALGGLTRGVTPLEMASAYGAFANRGVLYEPMAITKVIDRNGKVLEEDTPVQKSSISEKSAYVLTDLLRGVISRGTGGAANIGRPAAGKTGTTDDYRNAWFVGYTPDLVAAVWMGNDNNDKLAYGVTGGTIPARIWKAFMSKALAGTPPQDFYRPPGVVVDAGKPFDNAEDGKGKDQAKDQKDAVKDREAVKDKNAKPADGVGARPAVGPPPAADGKTPPPPPTKPEKNTTAPPPPPPLVENKKE